MAEIRKQIMVRVADAVGKLAELTGTLKTAGVNIVAACAWTEGEKGQMLLVTDDNDKAVAALSGQVEQCETSDVVVATVADEVGALNAAAGKLAAAGIAIKACYATTVGGQAMIVLDTADNAKAAEIL